MSRSDERTGRAWDEGMPSWGERLGLAIRQNPIRGLIVALLLLIALGFFAATVVAFELGESFVILSVGVILVALVLVVVWAGTWLSRQ